MKHIFTLLITVLFYSANAQNFPWIGQYYNEIPTRSELLDSSIAANNYHSTSRVFTRYTKKGHSKKKVETYSFKYDNKGFLTSSMESNSKNKKNFRYEFAYKDSALVEYVCYENDKLKRRYEITRNASKRITDLTRKNSKGEVVFRQHCDFFPEPKMLSRIAVYDKNNKEKRAIEYTYFDEKNMKQAKEYRKGKLKKVWNYTCDPAGNDDKKIKQVKVCKNVNADENGNRVETNRIVNPKGEVELRISTFDKNDKMIKQLVYDDLKHKLTSEWSYLTVNGNKEMVYKSYNKHGKQIYYNKAVFNSRERILSNEFIFGKKKKNAFRTNFEYNNKNLLIHSESFDSKNRKTSENIHTYN